MSARAPTCPFAADAKPGVIYLFDKPTGLYCSHDYGQTWIQVWAKTTSDNRTGWLAANPSTPGAAADIAATADLVALTPPEPRLPPWRIVPAKSQTALRADYRAAQAATGIGWSYLAAINFVETDFGRIAGPSSAGAQGPMQFLPATWAIYGHGDIHSPRAAIMAAARLLRADGGPRAIGRALYAYNPSVRYVDAVLRYAARLRADPRAFTSYYDRQVIYRLGGGWAWLPPGYGTNHAIHAVHGLVPTAWLGQHHLPVHRPASGAIDSGFHTRFP